MKSFVLYLVAVTACSLLEANVVLANDDPPRFVYRADFRGPDEIFQNGMTGLGNNDNLIDHVDGRSCNYNDHQANTAFIATSSEESAARLWAGNQLWSQSNAGRHDSIYIYRIRASENFYSAYDSLMAAFRRTQEQGYRRRADDNRFYHEWLAHGQIPANQFQRVTVYRRGSTQGSIEQFGEPRRNSNYRSGNTHGNRVAFAAGPINSDEVVAVPSRFTTLFTACFSVCREENASERSGTQSHSCPQTFKTPVTTHKRWVWDPVQKTLVLRPVPWIESVRDRRNRYARYPYQRPYSCWIDPGARGDDGADADKIRVHCNPNNLYRKFVVRLKAGGSLYDWVDKTFTDGQTGQIWEKWTRQIPVVGTSKTLKDYDYSINEVFAAPGMGWWSKFEVFPVYPDYASPEITGGKKKKKIPE